MVVSQDVINYFELFNSKLLGNLDYKFIPNQKQVVLIDNFIKLLDKKYDNVLLGENFLFNYLSFQFSIKYDRKTRFGQGVIYINHVVGPKSLEEWENRDESWSYYANIFLDKFNIVKKIEKKSRTILKSLEDIERSRFHNTDEGVFHCVNNSIKFDQHSKYCITCNYKTNCKKL